MQKNLKKLLVSGAALLTVGLPLSSTFTSVQASEEVDTSTNDSASYETATENVTTIDSYLTDEDTVFLNKLETIFPYFDLNETGQLLLNIDTETLISEFNFSVEEVHRLNNIITSQNNEVTSFANEEPIITPRVVVEDWKIYFTAEEVPLYLGAAIQSGAPAVIATLSTLGSTVPGIGTIIGAAAGIWGGSQIIYHGTQALVNNQGFYIGVDWNGVFPNSAIGTW